MLTTATGRAEGVCTIDCTLLRQQKSTTTFLSLSTLQDPVEIDLDGIIIEHGKLYVFLTDGQRNYTLQPRAKALTSFPLFQQFVFDEEGVLITHRAQNSPSVRRRRHDWEIALQAAFDRGAT